MASKTPVESVKKELTFSQKAAGVIVSLGTEKASQLYQYMEPEDVEALTLEVARLGMLNSEQTEEVLTEFYQNCLTSKAFGTQAAASMIAKLEKSFKNREFAFLNKADSKSLYSALQNERPQTMALVLSYVEPDKAAGVIEQLPPERQVRVVEAIATMESASPAAVKIIEKEMERKFSSIIVNSNVKVGGVDYVADIMNNLDRSSEKSIFDGLSVNNAELADEIRKRMFVFEDIITLDDRAVQRFLRECDQRDLVLALKTANDDVASKLFTNMSARMAETIRDDLEITSNVRMKDVEDAQQRIVGVIRDLEEKNEIVILKGGKDDIIA